MLKNVQSIQVGVPSDYDSFENVSPTDYQPQKIKKFIGYRKIVKRKRFFSIKTKFVPWQNDVPMEEWLTEKRLSPLTIKFRKDFKFYLRATAHFRFYQIKPIKIPFIDSIGKKRKYQPAALLTYRNDGLFPFKLPPLLIDIWSDEDINRHKSILHPAFRAANHFALSRNLSFRVFHNEFFLSDYFFNLHFISKYCPYSPAEENWNTIKKIFNDKQILNFSELIELFPAKNSEHLGRLIFDTWILVARGIIRTDWNKRFHKDTILWTNGDF